MVIMNWKRFFISMYYFLKLIFFSKNCDVVFVSSTAFNRGENQENTLLKPMIKFCVKNDLSHIIFEDTAFGTHIDYKINQKSVPFDFIKVIQIILRKIYHIKYGEPSTQDQVYTREKKLSKIIKKIFFRKFHSNFYITLIWNNVTLWRAINPGSCIVDYQHAYIFDGEDSYINNGRPPKLISDNNVVAFVHGNKYKSILIDCDRSNYYSEKNVLTVGLNKPLNSKKKEILNNKKILFTLQLTPDFNKKVNENYADIVKKIIDVNAKFLSENNYEIIFRHHPRFVHKDCPNIDIEYDFLYFDNESTISSLINEVSLHMTFNSNSAFDAAMLKIPTIFIDMHVETSPREMFLNQYQYPFRDLFINNYKDLKDILLKINNKQTYNQHCDDVHKWSKEFYQNFNEEIFGAFLFDCINNYKHDTEEKSNQYK